MKLLVKGIAVAIVLGIIVVLLSSCDSMIKATLTKPDGTNLQIESQSHMEQMQQLPTQLSPKK